MRTLNIAAIFGVMAAHLFRGGPDAPSPTKPAPAKPPRRLSVPFGGRKHSRRLRGSEKGAQRLYIDSLRRSRAMYSPGPYQQERIQRALGLMPRSPGERFRTA